MVITRPRKMKRTGENPVSLLKRKETLFRKCHELTVKSEAEVGLVCVKPDGREIETWPNHEVVWNMIMKYKEKKNNINGESEPKDQKKKKKKKGSPVAGNLSMASLTALLAEVESKLENVEEKIETTLSFRKAMADFCDNNGVNNNSGDFVEVYDYCPGLSTNMAELSYGGGPAPPAVVSAVEENI